MVQEHKKHVVINKKSIASADFTNPPARGRETDRVTAGGVVLLHTQRVNDLGIEKEIGVNAQTAGGLKIVLNRVLKSMIHSKLFLNRKMLIPNRNLDAPRL